MGIMPRDEVIIIISWPGSLPKLRPPLPFWSTQSLGCRLWNALCSFGSVLLGSHHSLRQGGGRLCGAAGGGSLARRRSCTRGARAAAEKRLDLNICFGWFWSKERTRWSRICCVSSDRRKMRARKRSATYLLHRCTWPAWMDVEMSHTR